MRAVEFIGKITNGVIKIPDEYAELTNAEVRVIILSEEPKPKTQKEKVVTQLKKVQAQHLFQDIEDPVAWQIKLRSDW